MEGSVEILVAELGQCNAGYNSRDSLVQESFGRIVTLFAAFLALLLTLNVFVEAVAPLRALLLVTVALVGGFSLVAITEDMASTASAKMRLRKRAAILRKAIRESDPGSDAKAVFEEMEKVPRRKFLAERFLDRVYAYFSAGLSVEEAETHMYLWVAYGIITLWIVVCAIVLVLGDQLTIRLLGGASPV